MARRLNRLKRDIILSIKYARLKEEVSDTKIKNNEIKEKKKLLGTKEKTLDKNKNFMDNAEVKIKEIEDKHKPKNYMLVLNDKLADEVSKLSKYKNFEVIKYSIATELILDMDFNYKNTDDFLEKISKLLFDDKYEISKIKTKHKEIEKRFLNTYIKDFFTSEMITIKSIAPNEMSRIAKNAVSKISKMKIAVGLGIAGVIGVNIYKRFRHSIALSQLEAGELARVLTSYALKMTFAKKAFADNEPAYRKYLKTTIKDITYQRISVIKDIFEKHFDIGQNKLKLELYHNFDNYFIELLERSK